MFNLDWNFRTNCLFVWINISWFHIVQITKCLENEDWGRAGIKQLQKNLHYVQKKLFIVYFSIQTCSLVFNCFVIRSLKTKKIVKQITFRNTSLESLVRVKILRSLDYSTCILSPYNSRLSPCHWKILRPHYLISMQWWYDSISLKLKSVWLKWIFNWRNKSTNNHFIPRCLVWPICYSE